MDEMVSVIDIFADMIYPYVTSLHLCSNVNFQVIILSQQKTPRDILGALTTIIMSLLEREYVKVRVYLCAIDTAKPL